MILGIDTSCYTTSLAVITDTGEILADNRVVLEVKPGERGLQQSAAIFQHLQNLPRVLDRNITNLLKAVVASTRPRPVSDSYLPVFRVGASFGEALANFMKVPFLGTSHQEGHIRAGLWGNLENTFNEPFLSWHLSGGTTELLFVSPIKKSDNALPGYQIEKVGGSSDLQVGQFIDRVGVSIGLGFPAGPALEQLALQSSSTESLPITSRGLELSFSGPAAAAERAIQKGIKGSDLARQVFNCIHKGILKTSMAAMEQYKVSRFLMVGGVSSSQIIRLSLLGEGKKVGLCFQFGQKELSSDNAVGVALIGYDFYRGM